MIRSFNHDPGGGNLLFSVLLEEMAVNVGSSPSLTDEAIVPLLLAASEEVRVTDPTGQAVRKWLARGLGVGPRGLWTPRLPSRLRTVRRGGGPSSSSISSRSSEFSHSDRFGSEVPNECMALLYLEVRDIDRGKVLRSGLWPKKTMCLDLL